MGNEMYDEDYFMRGEESRKSLYTAYSWKPDLTIPMVQAMIAHLGIERHHMVVDFGCARGYVVRAFRELGYMAYGLDCSRWATANCDPAVVDYLICGERIVVPVDWVIAKDVLEHVPEVEHCIDNLMESARLGVFAVVPLAPQEGMPYVVSEYEKDVTHVHRLPLDRWARLFHRGGWQVEASYRVVGIKENYWQIYNSGLRPVYLPGWEKANGFLSARRK